MWTAVTSPDTEGKKEVCPSLGRHVSGQEGRPGLSVLPGLISEELTATPRPLLPAPRQATALSGRSTGDGMSTGLQVQDEVSGASRAQGR